MSKGGETPDTLLRTMDGMGKKAKSGAVAKTGVALDGRHLHMKPPLRSRGATGFGIAFASLVDDSIAHRV